jgi:hypothetical protein
MTVNWLSIAPEPRAAAEVTRLVRKSMVPVGPLPGSLRPDERQKIRWTEAPNGTGTWIITEYELARSVLADSRLSRAAAAGPGVPKLSPGEPRRIQSSVSMARSTPACAGWRQARSPSAKSRNCRRLSTILWLSCWKAWRPRPLPRMSSARLNSGEKFLRFLATLSRSFQKNSIGSPVREPWGVPYSLVRGCLPARRALWIVVRASRGRWGWSRRRSPSRQLHPGGPAEGPPRFADQGDWDQPRAQRAAGDRGPAR